VLPASLTSAGDALASWLPKGTPAPSTTTIHFVPFPRLVLPMPSPLFCSRKTSVQKGFAPVQPALRVQFGEEGTPQAQPDALRLPRSESFPTHAGTDVELLWEITPAGPGLEDPEDVFKNGAVAFERTSPSRTALEFEQQRLDVFPLFIRQQSFSHPQLFTESSQRVQNKITYSEKNFETASNQTRLF